MKGSLDYECLKLTVSVTEMLSSDEVSLVASIFCESQLQSIHILGHVLEFLIRESIVHARMEK